VSMAYREYKWMTLDDANRAEPAAAEQAVSEVARGIVPSTVTDHGFMEVYRMVDGDPEEMHNVMATDNSTWAERRYQFVARHLAQGKEHKRKTGNNPWWRDGEPTRRHLGLMMWAYTPTPSQTARWLDSQDRKQNPMAPGYQSWKWIQEDWRTVIPHRDDTVDYSHKCGEGSLKTKSGSPISAFPSRSYALCSDPSRGGRCLSHRLGRKSWAGAPRKWCHGTRSSKRSGVSYRQTHRTTLTTPH